MYSTSVYFYIPRHTVVLPQGSSARRYETVYAKNLTLHKGVKNKLQFQFLNQDQKPINLTGHIAKFRLISDDGKKALLTKNLSISTIDGALPLTGIAVLSVTELELNSVNTQICKYSLELSTSNVPGEVGQPVFTDDTSGARGTVNIVNSVLPNVVPSFEVTIPSHQFPTQSSPVVYYSSVFTAAQRAFTTQIFYDNFSGNVKLQGSTTQNEDWYDIDDATFNYSEQTATIGYNFDSGIHPFYRLCFDSSGGDVTKILVR